MKSSQKLLTLLSVVFAFAIPAHANNPPQPDGLFSVLLIFPVVIFGARLAGVVPKPKRLWVRIIGGPAVAIVSLFFLAAGTLLGALAALVVLAYAIVCANDMVRQGHSVRRRLIAAFVVGFALFAFIDYYVSIVSDYTSPSAYEYMAESHLWRLSEAEKQFAESRRDTAGETSFGTMKDLETGHLIQSAPASGEILEGYLFGEILDTEKKHYVLYAVPAPQLKLDQPDFVPGASLFKRILGTRNTQRTGHYSFAVDETRQIRRAIRNRSGPVTREEVMQWPPCEETAFGICRE